MDTSDEWIVKRTGITERRKAQWDDGEKTSTLATNALRDALKNTGIDASEVDLILVATMTSDTPTPSVSCIVARDRFGIPEEKLLVNIHKYGNTVAASAPLVFEELRQAGKIKAGQKIMFLAFGAGLTWGSSLWQL